MTHGETYNKSPRRINHKATKSKNSQGVYSTDRSKAVVPVLVLLFVTLWFILRGDLFYVLLCVILFLCFSVLLALQLPRFGKRELILVLSFRTFERFVLVWICRFPLPLSDWKRLLFVIVALPGLFIYLFFISGMGKQIIWYIRCMLFGYM